MKYIGFLTAALTISSASTTTTAQEPTGLYNCQFSASATMDRQYGTIPAGDTLDLFLSYTVPTEPVLGTNSAFYDTSNGVATVTHPVDGNLNGEINFIQVINSEDFVENPFDSLIIWLQNGWQGEFGGISVPEPNLIINGLANGFQAIRLRDHSGTALFDTAVPLNSSVLNAFPESGTSRALRFTEARSNGGLINLNFATISEITGGCVPVAPVEEELMCDGHIATIVGTEGHDHLIGTTSVDVIVALGGNDTIEGLRGDDIICAGHGNDTVLAGNGNDIVFGGFGNDTLIGNGGNDVLIGERGNDTLAGGNGDDQLIGNRDNDTCIGRAGSDIASDCEQTDDSIEVVE